ncbi:hypothetical protein GIX81_10330 [Lactobacillus reuteri]|uniref:Uncharacterized protein n=1 Tax=Limosilactobacillus reuteri TaxID=1598 RepID=A0A6L5P670_LIMRT|nr:hypothetical protein [Limosilactobacillus reuteri]MRH09818.1 hypothetical protein [Limosilactobacillus reuteri]
MNENQKIICYYCSWIISVNISCLWK